ncbi:DNA polymerase IV [Massilia sp. W12]|uniref:DNA polymerase IV n=1 Tax=Massilia sp. W12 TaxID=3126507 RepID=UPI0030CBA520
MNLPQRKIIHCDCDCFFAAVEMRDNPALRDVPLAIGGSAEQRGVIATCNYVARRFGVHSAQPTSQALQLCPNLVLLRGDMEKYRQASRQIMAIYQDYTALVEPLSLDEAYLDVSQCSAHHGSATLIAQEIRARVRQQVGITVSAGVAPNKFLAKIASDWNKPDGLFVIKPQDVAEFVAVLPVEKLFGVGKVTAAKLRQQGFLTCADLQRASLMQLRMQFGSMGERLYELSRGQDTRAVSIDDGRKSVSVEETFTPDLRNLAQAEQELPALFAQLLRRIARADASHLIEKLYIKLRFNDFRITTVECGGQAPDLAQYRHLLALGYARKRLPMRLLGLGVRLHAPGGGVQLELFPRDMAMATLTEEKS